MGQTPQHLHSPQHFWNEILKVLPACLHSGCIYVVLCYSDELLADGNHRVCQGQHHTVLLFLL